MDAALIRAAFIRTNLDQAQRHPAGSLAARTAAEFRRYVDWYADTLPEPERKMISQQLAELERRVASCSSAPRWSNK